jgi:predicted HTH transcriptional regulator
MKSYPDYPGHRGQDTSKAAAQALAPRLNHLQEKALASIREYGGLTREQVPEKTEIAAKSIEPRVSELRKKGLIVDSGKRRKNVSGKEAIVWVAVELSPKQ